MGKITLESKIENDNYTQFLYDNYDIQNKEKTVTEVLITNIRKAIEMTGIKKVVLAGGVSANSYIRDSFKELEKEGVEVYFPELKLCTDNAAMIASAGYYEFLKGTRDNLELNAIPNLKF